MVGIGPFIAQKDSPFAKEKNGTLRETLLMLGLIRLTLPKVLLPATTALGTIDPKGREKGILAGANVVMPNLSPVSVRKKYELYDNKICTGEESAQCRGCLENRMESVGYHIVTSRGDYVSFFENYGFRDFFKQFIMWKCKDLMKMTDAVKPAKTGANVEVQINVTNIVKYVCFAGIAIVGIIFGSKSFVECKKNEKTKEDN